MYPKKRAWLSWGRKGAVCDTTYEFVTRCSNVCFIQQKQIICFFKILLPGTILLEFLKSPVFRSKGLLEFSIHDYTTHYVDNNFPTPNIILLRADIINHQSPN